MRVQRNAWGLQTISILLPWPKRGAELAFTLPHDRPIRNQRSTMGGVALPRSLTSSDGEMEVRLASNGKDGMAEIVLEVGEGKDEVSLPRFPDAVGTMTVQLRGDGWEGQCPLSRSVLYDQ